MRSAREYAIRYLGPHYGTGSEVELAKLFEQAMSKSYEAGRRVGYEDAAALFGSVCFHQKLKDESCLAVACGDLCEAEINKEIRELPIKPYGAAPNQEETK